VLFISCPLVLSSPPPQIIDLTLISLLAISLGGAPTIVCLHLHLSGSRLCIAGKIQNPKP
jgi:hypothetical protein